ncbi:MAG: peptidoglycan-associated lipoprotein Pal [Usitatibacter sp.]
MKQAALYLVLATLAVGCSSTETKKDAPVTDRSSGVTQPSQSASPGMQTTPNRLDNIAGNPLRDPNNILSKRSVYFDYDSNAVKDEYRGLVQAHSRYLNDKRDSRIRIEGNCDERGSREYNLALGQRRAEAVKKVMTVLGVSDGRIETISFGEEKPVAQGHDEQAWSQNRLADIKYSGE